MSLRTAKLPVKSSARVLAFAAILALSGAVRANAQVWVGAPVPHRGTTELSGGALASGGFDLGTVSATETRNPGTGTGPLELFKTSNRVASSTGAQARVGIYLTHAIEVEAGLQYLRPTLSSRITGDFEQAAEVTATDAMTRYVIDGSLLFHINALSFAGGRAVPYVSGGGGYLRELHQGQELIETGKQYQAGGGLKYWLGQGSRRFGVRADVGASIRDGGFDFRKGRRTLVSGGVSLAYMF